MGENRLDVDDRAAWREWLSDHHATEPEVLLIYHKGVTEGISHGDSVEEAAVLRLDRWTDPKHRWHHLHASIHTATARIEVVSIQQATHRETYGEWAHRGARPRGDQRGQGRRLVGAGSRCGA